MALILAHSSLTVHCSYRMFIVKDHQRNSCLSTGSLLGIVLLKSVHHAISQRSKYTQGVAQCMCRYIAIQRLSQTWFERKFHSNLLDVKTETWYLDLELFPVSSLELMLARKQRILCCLNSRTGHPVMSAYNVTWSVTWCLQILSFDQPLYLSLPYNATIHTVIAFPLSTCFCWLYITTTICRASFRRRGAHQLGLLPQRTQFLFSWIWCY